MNLRTAAQQALEALEDIADELISPYNDPIGKAILDLRTALAEPERKPLTDEEILSDEVLRYHFGCNGGAGPVSQKGIKIIRAVERAHGIGGEA